MQQIDDFRADSQLHHPAAAGASGLGASHQSEPESADHEAGPARPAARSSLVNGERREFDDLFDTVKGSLWGLLDQPAAGQPPWSPESTGSLNSRALQGTVALAQLHLKLTHEFQLREQLQREIVQAREALKQARAELAGTQAEARRVRHLAMHDELTDLPNRSNFRRRLEQALSVDIASRQSLAVLFVDLDRFKQVNDSLGHSAGDELLRIVGARMARTVRVEDTVSRLGGDEFACILVGLAGRDQAAHLAAKIRDAIQAPCRIGHQLVRVGASIGIAIYPADGADVDQLLLNADLAMYRAKSQSGGYAFRDGPIMVSLDIEI